MIKKIAKIFMAPILLVLIYYFSWLIFGENALYETGMKYFIDERDAWETYHQNEQFHVISKRHNKIIEHNYETIPSHKTIVSINTEEELESYYRKHDDAYRNNKIIDIGLEINIIQNSPFSGVIDFEVIPNDVRSRAKSFVWLFFDWVSVES